MTSPPPDQPPPPELPQPDGQPGFAEQPPVQPGPQPWVGPPQPYPGHNPAAAPRRNSGLAVAALVLGLVGLVLSWFTFGIPSLLALIFGVVALRQTGRGPGKLEGRGMALTGTILGGVMTALGALVSFLFVYAIGAGVNAAVDAAASTAPVPAASSPTEEEVTNQPTEEPTETATDQTYSFGEKASWEDGVTGMVRSVKRTSFGEVATTPGPGVRVTFTIINGSSTALDLSSPTVDVRLGEQGAAAEQVFAPGCGDAGDLGRLAPGRTVTGVACFSGRGVTVDVSFAPTFDYNAVTWTGKVS